MMNEEYMKSIKRIYFNFISKLNIDDEIKYTVIKCDNNLIFKNKNKEISIPLHKLQNYIQSDKTCYIDVNCKDISCFSVQFPLITYKNNTYGLLYFSCYNHYLLDRWMASTNQTFNGNNLNVSDLSNTNIAIYRYMNDEISEIDLDNLLNMNLNLKSSYNNSNINLMNYLNLFCNSSIST